MRALALSLLIFSVFKTVSQTVSPEVFSANGGYFQHASGSVAWTIGEAVSETYSNGNITTMGFHQPELNLETFINESGNDMQMRVFPNPVKDLLSLNFKSLPQRVYSLHLYDLRGRLVMTESMIVSETQTHKELSLSGLAASVYLLTVSSNHSLTTIKITKTE